MPGQEAWQSWIKLLYIVNMETQKLAAIISKMFAEIESLIPVYMQNQEDKNIANGNVAVCMIAEDGMV